MESESETSRRAWLAQAVAGGFVATAGVDAAAATSRPASDARRANVRDFGAVGDGVADDGPSIQAALDAATAAAHGAVFVPAGRYRVGRGLVLRSSDRFDLVGDGASSALLHEADEPLLRWADGASCRESSVRHLAFLSTGREKSPGTPTLLCAGGSERSLFSHLLFKADGAAMGGGIAIERVADTTTIEHCVMWGPIRGTGIRIARGSEVRIVGGRILGSADPFKSIDANNIGVHIVGGNGGVHLLTTDLIGLGVGLKIGEPGQPANREIFLTHATLDSCRLGLWQVDGAYTSIAGCWAASSDEAQILIDESARGAILSIAGGSIFNGGTYGRPGGHHGMIVRAGTFNLSGVAIRHNKGTGLLVTDGVDDYAVTGCRIVDNGTGTDLAGDGYAFTGNVVTRNGTNVRTRGAAANATVSGNVQR